MGLLQQMLGIVTVLGLLAASLWWLHRKGLAGLAVGTSRRKTRQNLELLERLPLTPQHSLQLVRAAGRVMLIAVSPAGCTLLKDFEVTALHDEPGEVNR